MTRLSIALSVFALLAWSQAASAQFQSPRTLDSETTDAGDAFGSSVAISGTRIVVGSSLDETGPGMMNTGSVTVFDAITGEALYRVEPPDGTPFDEFGCSVDADGDRFVVGARSASPTGSIRTGAAYLYELSTGTLLETFDPGDFSVNNFGTSVAIEAGRVLIGAPFSTGSPDGGKAVYVYDTTSGDLLRTLEAADATPFGAFGSAIAADGDLAIVGAPEQDENGTTRVGAAYVFDVSTGALLRKVDVPFPAAAGRFGFAVEISGTIAYVSDQRFFPGVSSTGSVYEIDALTGAFRGTFSRFCGISADEFEFGSSLLVFESYLAVGIARAEVPSGSNNQSGAIYAYRRIDRECVAFILPPGGGFPGGDFGVAMAYAAGQIAVGAPGNGQDGEDAGGAFVVETTLTCPADCNNDGEVGFDDLVEMLFTLGQPVVGDRCDPNLDGATTFNDLVLALFLYGPCV